MTSLTYYPGCSLRHSAAEFDRSTKIVLDAFGVDFVEVPEWTCCGSSPAHMTDHLLAQALAARNLRQAAAIGDEMFAPCPSCYQREKDAAMEIHSDPDFRAEVNELLDEPYEGTVRVMTLPEVLMEKVGEERVRAAVTTDLVLLKVVPYYGCLLGRPYELIAECDDEQPMIMDRLLTAAGCDVRPWDYKTECCGASVGMAKPEIHRRLSRKVLQQAMEAGADAVVVACPLCHQNLDLRQSQVNATCGTNFHMPILYLTQVLGYALGRSEEELLFHKHAVDPRPLLRKVVADAVKLRADEARRAAEMEERERAREAAKQARAKRRATEAGAAEPESEEASEAGE